MPNKIFSTSLLVFALAACEPPPPPSAATKPTLEPPKNVAVPAAALPAPRVEPATAPKPEPEPEATPDRGTPAALLPAREERSCRLSLNRLEMASSIEKREPVRLLDAATADGQPIYAFTDFRNELEHGEKALVEWIHPATGYFFAYEVEVGKHPRYRTWTRHRIPASREGTWKIRVKDGEGCVVGETTFEAEGEPLDEPSERIEPETFGAEAEGFNLEG